MVAKTFQNLPQVGEPFESGGKMYVNVQGKNGNVRRVRWYEVDEYIKMYPDTPHICLYIVNVIEIAALRTSQKHRSGVDSFSKRDF